MAVGNQPKRRRRLSKSADFDRVYREGKSRANRAVVVYRFSGSEAGGAPRLGLSVNRKIGGAVLRNKVKRALKEAFWSLDSKERDGFDYVLVARPQVATMLEQGGYDQVRESLAEVIAMFSGEEED